MSSASPSLKSTKKLDEVSNKNMSFYEALEKVSKGNRIARREWEGEHPVYLSEGFLCIDMDKKCTFIIRDIDMLATDWFII